MLASQSAAQSTTSGKPAIISNITSVPGGIAGAVGAGIPVYTNKTGSFTAGIGVQTSFAPPRYNMPPNHGVGVGFRFRF